MEGEYDCFGIGISSCVESMLSKLAEMWLPKYLASAVVDEIWSVFEPLPNYCDLTVEEAEEAEYEIKESLEKAFNTLLQFLDELKYEARDKEDLLRIEILEKIYELLKETFLNYDAEALSSLSYEDSETGCFKWLRDILYYD